MNRTYVFCILFFLLLILIFRFISYYQQQLPYNDKQAVHFTETLSDIPKIKTRTQHFSLSLPRGPQVYITTARFPEFAYGDQLEIQGVLVQKDLGDRKILTLSYPEIAVKKNTGFYAQTILYLREQVTTLYNQTLPQTAASLLSGIVLGIKEQMPEEFESNLRQAGVMHVIAASGMNVAMVAGAVFAVCVRFFARRKAIGIALGGIIFYAMLSGLEPSIVRATIMAGLALLAGYFGRQYFGLLALFLTGYSMLLFDPAYLTDVGFQLSFLATLGIMYVKPPESFLVVKSNEGSTSNRLGVLDDLQVTITAQIATVPILLATFGEYGLLSIFVNALVLWTIPILMILGGIGAIIGLLIPFLGKLVIMLTLPFLWYFEFVVRYFGSMGYVLAIDEVPMVFVLAYYACLLVIVLAQKPASEKQLKEKKQ